MGSVCRPFILVLLALLTAPQLPARSGTPAWRSTTPRPAPASTRSFLPLWKPIDDQSDPPGSSHPTWTPVKTTSPAPGSGTVPWQPLNDPSELEPAPSTRQRPERRPPTNREEAEALLKNLPLQASDYPPLLRLGAAVPTADVLDSRDTQLDISQTSPPQGGSEGGTGNQNYQGSVSLALSDRLMLSAFYSESDDPLYARITGRTPQPENLWRSSGASLRWQMAASSRWRLAIEGSLEQWNVRSGGCNGYGCSNTSANIFNTSLTPVSTNNLIGSVSLPISWKISKSIAFSIAPGVSFLPDTQGNADGSGQFYGTNFSLASGISFQPSPQVGVYLSALLPLGPGNNSFDSSLSFQRVPIWTTGLRYALNPRIALEGYLSNGFGATAGTALLALPSDNHWLYGGRLVITPNRPDGPPIPRSAQQERRSLGGFSVSTADLLTSGERRLRGTLSSDGRWWSRADIGLSQLFTLDLAVGQINTSAQSNSPLTGIYLQPGSSMVRGGGSALLLSQARGDALSSALRLSFGRVLGENRAGYLFAESMNTYQLSPNLSFNLNPKLAWTSSTTPWAIGASLNWQITPWLSVIPEANIGGSGSQSNWTLGLRGCPSDQICIELYGSTSLSLMDMGQLLATDTPAAGIGLNYRF